MRYLRTDLLREGTRKFRILAAISNFSSVFVKKILLVYNLVLSLSFFLWRRARGDRERRGAFSARSHVVCRGSEFALILAMLLRPCLGQAMVCMVVLSAAALASQTHYSYLNEFSLAPYPLSRPDFSLLLLLRQLCVLWPRVFLSTIVYFCKYIFIPCFFSICQSLSCFSFCLIT